MQSTTKHINVMVHRDLHAVYQDEAIRRSRASGERVTLLQVVTETLQDGAQRILDKQKTVGVARGAVEGQS